MSASNLILVLKKVLHFDLNLNLNYIFAMISPDSVILHKTVPDQVKLHPHCLRGLSCSYNENTDIWLSFVLNSDDELLRLQ